MTQTPVRLIPLVCVKCRAPVQANPDELAWVCEQCGQGQILDETRGLIELPVFFSRGIAQGQRGRPFWVTRGQVSISMRETFKGNEERAAREFWAGPRLFYIPAWDASLDETIALGVQMLLNPQRMETGSPAPFLPVTTGPDDLRALAEFMVISIEADRRDAMKKIDFGVTLEQPQLWVME